MTTTNDPPPTLRVDLGPAPRRDAIPTGLIQLLPVRFAPSTGCYAEAGGIGLLVRCTGPAPNGFLDLEVRLLPLRLQGAVGLVEEPPDEAIMEYLLAELASDEARHRASACQALGHLAIPAVAPKLLQVASEDPDAFVQQVARAALAGLEMPVVPRAALAGVALRLDCTLTNAGGERVSVGPLETSGSGSALFRGVPVDSSCSLQLVAAPVPPDSVVPNLAKLLAQLRFCDTEVSRLQEGPCSAAVFPQEIGETHHFGALLRFTPPLQPDRGDCVPDLAVCRGAEFWSPTFVQPAIGLAWFNRLPRGEFQTRVSFDFEGCRSCRPSRPLLALHSTLLARTAGSAEATGPQILHPSDQRLLAIIEQGRRGEVVLTVQTEAPTLQTARVRYELGAERGELTLAAHGARPLWRNSRHLQQRWRGDEAVRLAVNLAPSSG